MRIDRSATGTGQAAGAFFWLGRGWVAGCAYGSVCAQMPFSVSVLLQIFELTDCFYW